jgi:hypothetical protein
VAFTRQLRNVEVAYMTRCVGHCKSLLGLCAESMHTAPSSTFPQELGHHRLPVFLPAQYRIGPYFTIPPVPPNSLTDVKYPTLFERNICLQFQRKARVNYDTSGYHKSSYRISFADPRLFKRPNHKKENKRKSLPSCCAHELFTMKSLDVDNGYVPSTPTVTKLFMPTFSAGLFFEGISVTPCYKPMKVHTVTTCEPR